MTKPQQLIIKSKPKKINAFIAGQGSGKTHAMGVLSAHLVSQFPKATGFIAANTYSQLSTATLKRIKAVWATLGIEEYTEANPGGMYTDGLIPPDHFTTEGHNLGNKYQKTIAFRNGAVVFHGSLDNYKAHDGKELGWALLDETKDTKEDAIKEVILGRLRQGIVPNDPLYIFTSPAKTDWFMDMLDLQDHEQAIANALFGDQHLYLHEDETKRVVLSGTQHNAHNLGYGYIDSQLRLLSKAKADMLIYGYPFAQAGGEFYHAFTMADHVKPCQYEPSLPLHLSFDFNVMPYLSAQAWQIEGKSIRLIHEVAAKHPHNNSQEAACQIMMPFANHQSIVYIHGDPAGKARSTRQKAGANEFTLIAGAINFPKIVQVLSKAPSVSVRCQFINDLLNGAVGAYTLAIDPKCEHSIKDLLNVRQDADGTKNKTKIKGENGETYEPYGHMSDAMDYFLIKTLYRQYKHYEKSGTHLDR